MAHFVLDARGRAVVVALPEGVRPSHRRAARSRKRFITATLPDGRLVSVLVDVLCTREDGSRYALVHEGQRLWNNYLKRDAVRASARQAEAALRYRMAIAA